MRVTKPLHAKTPQLGELDENPWNYNPRDSYNVIIGGGVATKNDSIYNALDKPECPVYPYSKDVRLVNINNSGEDNGDLERFAEDDPMYHPDAYAEYDTKVKKVENSWINSRIKQLLAAEDQGKGVFSGKDYPDRLSGSFAQQDGNITGNGFKFRQNGTHEQTHKNREQVTGVIGSETYGNAFYTV